MKALRLFKKYFLDSQPAQGPVKQNDFDMYLEPVDFEKYLSDLQSSGFSHATVETIVYNNVRHNVIQLDINSGSKKRLLIFSGVHGNEFAAASSVTELLHDIRQKPEIYKQCHIRIITPLNPVGFVHQSRYNETGRDINRDFKNFLTVGGKLQRKIIQDFKPDFLVSLHEGPQDGFFVVAEGDVKKELKSILINALKTEKVQLARKSFLQLNIGEGYWQKNDLFYAMQKLLGIYTLGRYSHDLHIPQLTTESPWTGRDIEARKKPHVITIRTVAAFISVADHSAVYE
jgi:hypothetical protein